jgi:hypothetical protein
MKRFTIFLPILLVSGCIMVDSTITNNTDAALNKSRTIENRFSNSSSNSVGVATETSGGGKVDASIPLVKP